MSEDATTTESTEAEQSADETTVDWRAKFEAEREHSRTWEKRAKENKGARDELESLRAAQMSEVEKAVAAARAEGIAEGAKEAHRLRVENAVIKAAANRPINVDALLKGLNHDAYITEDGTADDKAITAWLDELAPIDESVDIGQGTRGSAAAPRMDPLTAAVVAKVGGHR